MSSDAPQRPALRVVAGNADAEEVAVLTALLTSPRKPEQSPERTRRGGWNDPAAGFGRPLRAGPNGWRAAYLG